MGSLSQWAHRSASAASVPLEDPTAAVGAIPGSCN